MRVLIASSTFPLFPDDGSPRFIYDLARHLVPHCEVMVLVPGAPGVPVKDTWEGVAIRRFDYFVPSRAQCLAYHLGMRENMRASWLAKAQMVPYVTAQISAMRGLLRSWKPDVVNSHWIVPQGLTSTLALGRHPKARHVISLHGGDAYLLRGMPFGKLVAKKAAASAQHIFSSSSRVRDILDQLIGVPSGAEVQPMGVDERLFSDANTVAAPTTPFSGGYLFFCGRLIEFKGVSYLLRAMPSLQRSHPDLGLIIAGDGPLQATLREEAETLALGNKVHFVGQVCHEKVAAYMAGSQAVVVPSVMDRYNQTDGMPTVISEALAAGAKVVASSVGGIPDVINHGKNGWLCEEKDSEDLAKVIRQALETPDSEIIRQAARRTVEDLRWSAIARRYHKAFLAASASINEPSNQ